MRTLLVTTSFALALCSPLAAQEEMIKGVYLGSQELCAQAKKDSLQSVIEGANLVLTNRGLDSIEFNCVFLQVLKNPRMPGWVATSMCEEPDNAYPELFSIVERRDGELDLAAMSEVAQRDAGDESGAPYTQPQEQGEAQPGADGADPHPAPGADDGAEGEDTAAYGLSGTYYRCDGVEMP